MLTIDPFKLQNDWHPYLFYHYNADIDIKMPIIRMVYLPNEEFYLLKNNKTVFHGKAGDAIIWKVDTDEDINIDFPFMPCIKYIFNDKYMPIDKIKDDFVKQIIKDKWIKMLRKNPKTQLMTPKK